VKEGMMMKKIILLLLMLLSFGLVACGNKQEQALEELLKTVSLPSELVGDLELPATYSNQKLTATATWTSSRPEILSDTGVVTMGLKDEAVVLTLQLALPDARVTRQFAVLVKGRESHLQDILDTISIPSEVTGNLDLKTSYSLAGITAQATWQTTASRVISQTGVITPTVSDQMATLILKLSLEDASVTKHFDIVVKGSEDFLILYAIFNNQVVFENRELSENTTFPTSFTLDNKTATAVWTSSNEAVLEADGTIHPTSEDVEVTMTLNLSYGYASRTEQFTFIVLLDPATSPVNTWHFASVWTEPIAGEALDPATPNCFAGAVYRKVVSSEDYWLGIEAVVTIPEFTPDSQRFDDTKLSYYLDNSSLYLGGHANYESDVGIGWSIAYENPLSSTLSHSGIAFRPFWRYITRKEECPNNNCYRNADVRDYEYYYYPGDKIRMSVFCPKRGYLQMRIELLELTKNTKFIHARDAYNLGENFNRIFITPMFPSEGMGAVKTEFKRVNAIDQVANEGKPTLTTNAKVENAIWHEVYLYRKINEVIYKVPMTENRSAHMRCPLGSNVNGNFSNAFIITYNNVDRTLGGEEVTINPRNGTGKLYNTKAILPKKEDYELAV